MSYMTSIGATRGGNGAAAYSFWAARRTPYYPGALPFSQRRMGGPAAVIDGAKGGRRPSRDGGGRGPHDTEPHTGGYMLTMVNIQIEPCTKYNRPPRSVGDGCHPGPHGALGDHRDRHRRVHVARDILGSAP